MKTASKNHDLNSLHCGELEQTDLTNREETDHFGNGGAAIISCHHQHLEHHSSFATNKHINRIVPFASFSKEMAKMLLSTPTATMQLDWKLRTGVCFWMLYVETKGVLSGIFNTIKKRWVFYLLTTLSLQPSSMRNALLRNLSKAI